MIDIALPLKFVVLHLYLHQGELRWTLGTKLRASVSQISYIESLMGQFGL
jgi:hypothetical protein